MNGIPSSGRFSVPMAQLAELWITNMEAWEILARAELAEELQKSVRRAFRAKGVRPYVRDLKPATAVGDGVPLTKDKVGLVATYITIHTLVFGLHSHRTQEKLGVVQQSF